MEYVGVANGRGYQEVGLASGWNLWVWLASVVVRRYNYYRYPHNNYYFPLLHLYFFVLVYVIVQCYN